MFVESRRLVLLLLSMTAAGCTCGGTPDVAPRLDAVTPAWTFDTEATTITLSGEAFTPRASLPLGVGPEALKRDDTFEVYLGELRLEGVAWVDAKTVTAKVPAGLSVGAYEVRLVDPYGVAVSKPDGFSVRTRQGAHLSLSLNVSATTVRVGASVRVDAVVTNDGDTAARRVVVTGDEAMGSAGVMQLGKVAGRSELEPGESATTSFTFGTSMIGEKTFFAHASGEDTNSLSPLSAPVTASPTVTVLSPPIIEGVATVTRPVVSVGQPIVLDLIATNRGQVAVQNLQPTVAATPAALVDPKTAPLSRDVQPGASQQFEFTFDTLAEGAVTFDVDALGVDDQTGMPVTMQRTQASVTIVDAAALELTVMPVASPIIRGNRVTVSGTVRNTGEAKALNVMPTAVVTGAGGLTQVVAPSAIASLDGTAVNLTWEFDAATAGMVQVTLGASGSDENSGVTVAAAPVSVSFTIDAPGQITGVFTPATQVVNVGQTFPLSLTVSNSGGSPVIDLTPDPMMLSGAGAATLVSGPTPATAPSTPPGGMRSFAWSYSATQVGSITFSTAASGHGPSSSVVIATPPASATVTVQRPAALTGAITGQPLKVNAGQSFGWSVTVQNTGDSAANAVTPSGVMVVGTTSATTDGGAMPASQVVPGGTMRSFAFTSVAGADAGTFVIRAVASGTDAVDSRAVTTGQLTSTTVTVELPGALSGTLTIPPVIRPFDQYAVSMQVTNTGGAMVNAVTPSTLTLTGGGSLISGPVPANANLAGGASQTFVWQYRAPPSGTVQLSGTASGTDINVSQTVTTPTLTSNTADIVADVQAIATDPFGDATAFSYVFSYQGRVWLGPRKTGSGAVSMNADGSSSTAHTFSFLKDTSGHSHDNTSSAPYPSIGAPGCALNTGACGPNNEHGRGLFGSGTLGGFEAMGISGAHPTSGSLQYIYITYDTGPNLTFRYIDLSSGLDSGAKNVSWAQFFNNRLYLGFPSTGNDRPWFLALLTLPVIGSGINAQVNLTQQSGTDAINLQGDWLPGLGNDNGNPTPMQQLDTMAELNDRLYVGNNGGLVRSTTNTPRNVVLSSGDWATATPMGPAYTSKPSLTTPKLSGLNPSDKAWPGMVAYKGRFYAARNTTTGPQLWSCNPGGDSQCQPSEWSLIAANTTGDTLLSQFNSTANASISLLGATANALYVGYDNAAGVQVFKTTVAAPSARTDFVGGAGCIAGNAGCHGLNGQGFGSTVNKQIYDSRLLRFAGTDYVYLVSGDGTAGVRVWRIND